MYVALIRVAEDIVTRGQDVIQVQLLYLVQKGDCVDYCVI